MFTNVIFMVYYLIMLIHVINMIQFKDVIFKRKFTQKKTWFHRNQKLIVPLNSERGKGFTVYGAVGLCIKDDLSHFEVHDSTNKNDFVNFMINLSQKIEPR